RRRSNDGTYELETDSSRRGLPNPRVTLWRWTHCCGCGHLCSLPALVGWIVHRSGRSRLRAVLHEISQASNQSECRSVRLDGKLARACSLGNRDGTTDSTRSVADGPPSL